MIAEIGFGSLCLSLVVSVYGLVAAIYGERKHLQKWVLSANQSMRLVFPLLTVSIGALMF